MSEAQSLAELIKAHVMDSIANKPYSDLDIDGRKHDFAALKEKHPDRTFSQQHYMTLFTKELRKQKKDPLDYGLGTRIVKKKSDSSSIGGTTSSAPKNVIKKDSQLQTTTTKPQLDKDGKPIQTPATQEQIQKDIQNIRMKFTEKNVGATIKAMYGAMRWVYPALEGMSDEEKEDLADLWLPFFEKYLQSDYAIILIPLFASAAILSPKIKKAKIEKEKNKSKSVKELQSDKKKLEEKITRLENESREKNV